MVNGRNNLFAAKIRRQQEVRNYRPVTCFTTVYKTLTGITAGRISTHLQEHSLFSAGETACRPGSKGCRGQLMISKAIYKDCRKRRTNYVSIDLIGII
jgi:hypothetical protein